MSVEFILDVRQTYIYIYLLSVLPMSVELIPDMIQT